MKNFFKLSLSPSRPNGLTRSENKDHLGLYGEEEFFSLIEIERSRSHRANGVFSLIVIKLPNDGDRPFDISLIVNRIGKRIRKIDQIGWYDQNSIGVLLPNTDVQGVKIIAEELYKTVDAHTHSIDFQTFCYPVPK